MESTIAKFKVNCKTVFGESIFLIGNINELNSWDSSKAIKLTTSNYSEEDPIWETHDLVLPVNTEIEYKFFKKTKSNKLIWEWDLDKKNRKLILTERNYAVIFSNFGMAQNEIILKDEMLDSTKKDNTVTYGLQIVMKCNIIIEGANKDIRRR